MARGREYGARDVNTARGPSRRSLCKLVVGKLEGFRLKVVAAVVEALEDGRKLQNLVIVGKKKTRPNPRTLTLGCGFLAGGKFSTHTRTPGNPLTRAGHLTRDFPLLGVLFRIDGHTLTVLSI